MEIRGVKLKKQTRYSKSSGFFVLREPEYFSVPLLADDGEKPLRAVNVGDMVKEGTLIAKPTGRYGSYVYSPCSGKVIGVSRKLNASGNECEHVVIARDLENAKEYLPAMSESDMVHEQLLKRLYQSGMIDNFEPYDPAYKKYLLRCKIKTLIINCTEDDPYKTSDTALIETYPSEILEGARLLRTVAKAENILFVFTKRQKALVKIMASQIKKLQLQKTIKIKVYPDVYPLHDSRLIAYYATGKMVAEGTRTATTSVIVEAPSNCYDFFNAVKKNLPCIQKAVTISGKNCLRKANYFVKNGISIEHILNIVGTKEEYDDNMLIYGGIMSGIAQETLDISATLTASCILFINREEYAKDHETPCINCGKCIECCPVRLHVKNLDDAIVNREYTNAKNLGVAACIGCGACSYICPAKRYLTQRISFVKDLVLGKTGKKANTSEFVEVDEKPNVAQDDESFGILQAKEKYVEPKVEEKAISAVDEMLDVIKKEQEMEAVKNRMKVLDETGGDRNE